MHANESRDVPRDFDGLRSLVAERRAELPKRLAQVAEFAVSRPDEMAFGTAASIAEMASVQPSTLVRFAQALGYQGFTDLQQVFRAHLVERWPAYQKRLEALADPGAGAASIHRHLGGLVEAASASLAGLRDAIDMDRLGAAARQIAGAETVYLVGQRRVFPIAAYCAYALSRLDIPAVLVDNVGALGPEQAKFAGPGDVLVAVSFTPYAPLTAEIAAEAFHREVPVVAVTDSPFSPLVRVSSVWLEVAEADYGGFRSLAASMTLAMTLAIEAADLRRGRKR